jgi:hypothetical protein
MARDAKLVRWSSLAGRDFLSDLQRGSLQCLDIAMRRRWSKIGRAQKARGFYPSKARNLAISCVAPSLMLLGWKGEVLYPMCRSCAVLPPLGRAKKHCGKHCLMRPASLPRSTLTSKFIRRRKYPTYQTSVTIKYHQIPSHTVNY